MYKTFATLDKFGFLWYHARVKLGCFATAPSDLTGQDRLCMNGQCVCGNGARKRLFPPLSRHFRLSILPRLPHDVRCFCPSLRPRTERFSAESGHAFHCLWKARLSDCREQPDLGGRAGEVGADFRICGMLTAATYPEDTVLSRAVSRKSYQEEN